MADDDQSIWDSVDQPEVVEAPQAEVAEPAVETPRDERGRFAPKAATEQEAEPPAAQQEAVAPPVEPSRDGRGIPPFRLKEEAEARRAAEERAANSERMLQEMQRRLYELQKQSEPKPAVPDIWENADGFVDHRTNQAIEPIKGTVDQLREYYSHRDAVREYGAEKVKAAYVALAQGLNSRDPEVVSVYQRAMSSIDPYADIMKWHKRQTIFSTIGDDPDAFVERQIEARLNDPSYQAKILERIRGGAQARPSTVTPLPPSLNRATAAVNAGDDEDESDAGLLNAALRR